MPQFSHSCSFRSRDRHCVLQKWYHSSSAHGHHPEDCTAAPEQAANSKQPRAIFRSSSLDCQLCRSPMAALTSAPPLRGILARERGQVQSHQSFACSPLFSESTNSSPSRPDQRKKYQPKTTFIYPTPPQWSRQVRTRSRRAIGCRPGEWSFHQQE